MDKNKNKLPVEDNDESEQKSIYNNETDETSEENKQPVRTDYNDTLQNTAKHENGLNVDKVRDNKDPAE